MKEKPEKPLIKRIYEEPEASDGQRILVDRLWPRGLSKEKAKVGDWFKDIAPSNELRRSFHSGNIDFKEFRSEYLSQLSEYDKNAPPVENEIAKITDALKNGKVTLLFGLTDPVNNNAAILREYIEER